MTIADNYLAAFFAARDALKRAAAEQDATRSDTSLPLPDRMDAGTMSDELLQQLGHLESANNVLQQEVFTIPAPPADVILAATRLANELAGLIASSIRAVAMVERAIGIVTAFNTLAVNAVSEAKEIQAPAVGAELANANVFARFKSSGSGRVPAYLALAHARAALKS